MVATEPGDIDTRSLADALGEEGHEEHDSRATAAPKNNASSSASTPAPAAKEPTKTHTQTKTEEEESGAGGYVIGDEPEGNEPTSPETLSPVSARSLSPVPTTTPATTTAAAVAAAAPSVAADARRAGAENRRAQTQTRPSDSVQSLHSMFPDLDLDTVALVLDSTGGNTEAAINALLQMNDPSFQAPAESTQLDADAALAAHLAAEQDRDIDRARLHQQQRRSGPARGGGVFGSLLHGGGGPTSQSSTTGSSSYDPSKLAYQPRVRKTAAPPSARAAYQAPPPNRAHDPSQSLIPGLPGPNEAKQWQEEFNRFAEVGISKAASTFSALKAKAAASFGADSSSPGTPTSGSISHAESRSTSSFAPQRGSQPPSVPRERSGSNSSFSNLGSRWSLPSLSAGVPNPSSSGPGRNVSGSSTGSNPRGLMSPTGFDKDATAVGEDELAQILARGSIKPPSKDHTGSAGEAPSRANAAEDDEELLGWGGAARTKPAVSTARSQKELPNPVQQESSSVSAPGSGSHALSAPIGTGSLGAAAGIGAVAGGIAGAGVIAGERRSLEVRSEERDTHGMDDSDEEEYVSNPFADDD
ncbi:hypothetical protein A4X13_0g1902 [Tilletia indica]|uniref:Uncharacterized protein n=1 Tax=Tilletia indica TaxID=43049 RepID=A0A177TL06_9BASI|nr:hypothetical protein A4X13_0g1902 [Tilletia indica]